MPPQDVAVTPQEKETAVINTPEPTGFNFNDKKRPAALNLTHQRTGTSSSSSSESSLKVPRTPRFAEATSVHSPVDDKRSPFADPINPQASESQPSDVGFGYIGTNSHRESIPMPPKSPLKSAMKVPGTPARTMHILSPTFREEAILEKRELETEKEQARDFVSPLFYSTLSKACDLTNHLFAETQGPRSHGQIRPSKRPLQLLAHYPRHALLVICHLQRHQEPPSSERHAVLGQRNRPLGTEARPVHGLPVSRNLRRHLYCLLPWRASPR